MATIEDYNDRWRKGAAEALEDSVIAPALYDTTSISYTVPGLTNSC